jgi:putative ABC transport system ATP-binding protein
LIELDRVNKIFNQGRHNALWAVRDVSLAIEGGRLTCLRGPSGSGKSTLLAMIGCLSRPTSGRISLRGEPLSGLPERFMTQMRRRTFGFVFQRFNLIHGLSLLENVMLPAYPDGPDHRALRERAVALIARFGLAGAAYQTVEWLSGGETQRAAICRALINDPQVLIADEPTANLDSALSETFMQIAAQLVAAGRTLIVSSHDPRVYESAAVHRVVSLRDGRIVEA